MKQNTYKKTEKASDLNKYYQKIKIDSFKIRIPIEKVTFISSTFCEEYQKVYLSTGEIDEQINLEKHKTTIVNGITCRIGVASFLVDKNQVQEFVYFQPNSKMLEGNYLKGIVVETIKQVYDYIISQNIVYVSYEDFLEGFVSDIDFAYDIRITAETMIVLISRIYSKIRQDKYKYVDKPFKRDSNVGIQFNTRQKATPSTPNIKIYHKGLEMEHHSREFYDSYLLGKDLSEYGRLEFTLKNKKHQEYLGISIKTLEQLLEIDVNIMEPIVLQSIPENYVEKNIYTKDLGKLTPTEVLIVGLMEKSISLGSDKMDIYNVLSKFDNSDLGRRDKSRGKKILDNLMSFIETGATKTMVSNKKLNDVLRVLKFDVLGI